MRCEMLIVAEIGKYFDDTDSVKNVLSPGVNLLVKRIISNLVYYL